MDHVKNLKKIDFITAQFYFLAPNQKSNLLDTLLCNKLNCPYCCCGLTNGFGLLELDNGDDGLLAPIEKK